MRARPAAAIRAAWILCLIAAAGARAPQTSASWVEPLFMPGEVVEKHASFEKDCTKCHRPFDKQAQSGLCLECHSEIRGDLAARRGYHGRSEGLADRRCESCHTEHAGRAARIAPLDPQGFDHRATDFPLLGTHAETPCAGCHGAAPRHRDAPGDCDSCHAGDEPHGGSLGGACDLCHEERAWDTVRFDHRQSAFPLLGKHRDAPCSGCHATRAFKPTAADCRACHAGDDHHRGGLGPHCGSCHTPRAWRVSFDHARRTRFPLLGKHAAAACADCHRGAVAPRDTAPQCHACHASDDAHDGRFGARCESCHTPRAWPRSTFDHARDTDFPLRGRHQGAPCASCHRARGGAPPPTACHSCHRDRDVHRGREGTRCHNCHDERGWSRGVLLDHDATRFPLTGVHARTACTSCHLSPRFTDVHSDCLSCHEKVDVHRGAKGPRCERCHDATSWKNLRAAP